MFICSCQSFDSLCNANTTCVYLCVYVFCVFAYMQQKERTINKLHKCRNKRLRQYDKHTHRGSDMPTVALVAEYFELM